jgi:uncharacterized protein (DUF4415 family)
MPKTKLATAARTADASAGDPEMSPFERDLLASVQQALRGEGRVTTPAQIEARVAARRGRPVGSTKAAPKVQTAIRFDPDVLAAFRAAGPGWQTRMNDALRDWLRTHPARGA